MHRKHTPCFALTLLLGARLAAHAQKPPEPTSSPPAPVITMVASTFTGEPGFFRVGRATSGHWYFADPQNRPFFFCGVTSVSRANAWGKVDPTRPNLYAPVVQRKYGTDAAFREGTFRRLREWNFNALGAWSEDILWDQGMPYTIILDFIKVGPQLLDLNFPNIYDPAWAAAIEKQAQTLCYPHRDSKDLIGYFTDNELSWPAPTTIAQEQTLGAKPAPPEPSLLQKCLSQPATSAEYKAAWELVHKRHGTEAARLAREWGVTDASPEAIARQTRAKIALTTPGFLADDEAFVRQTAERYFRLSAETIRRFDTNHLLLGCRFGGPPSPAVFSAVRRPWVDVVSANNYRDTMYERMDIYWQSTHLPVLNTEFAWASDYFLRQPAPNEPPEGLPVMERMLRKGKATLERAFTHPALVGYTWYRWVDKPDQKPPTSYGIVMADDAPNWAHLGILAWLNANAPLLTTRPAPTSNR